MIDMPSREHLMQGIVDETVSDVNRRVWTGVLTAAESRLVWLEVINHLLQSVEIEQRHEVIKEHMGL